MDNSQYVVCFGAESALKLINQRGGQLFRGRRAWRSSRGMNRGRGFYGRGFYYNGGRWNGSRGARGNRGGRGRGRGGISSGEKTRTENGSSTAVTEERGDLENMETLDAGNEEIIAKCPVVANMTVLGDSFAFRMCKAVDPKLSGKFLLCEGGLTMNELKSRLDKCQPNDFKTPNVLIFMGMNDVRKVKVNDYDGEMFSLFSKLKVIGAKCKFYVCTLPMLPGDVGKCITHFNRVVNAVTSIDKSFIKIDLESVFVVNGSVAVKFYEKMYQSDKQDIHPNVEGLKKIFDLILKSVV